MLVRRVLKPSGDAAYALHLLSDRHHPQTLLTPVRQQIDAVPHIPHNPIQLPDHERCDRTTKDFLLQPGKGRPVQRCATLHVLIPRHRLRLDLLAGQPVLHLRPLAVRFLALR